ncbi:hypothetical protein BJP27_13495 [Pseudomonas oryzihabitans]|nr:hypothetical protein BJP27_13495 [Pseudomonas psychrotolerans]
MLRVARNIPGIYQARSLSRALLSTRARESFSRQGYIYHETNFIAANYNGSSVVTVHDLSHNRFPEFHPKEAIRYLNKGLPETLRKVRSIITVSQFTKDELVSLYDVDESKIETIHLAAGNDFKVRGESECYSTLSASGLKYKKYILSVCTLQPRKNLSRLVQAFSALPDGYRTEFPLVLIGANGWMNSSLLHLLQPLVVKGQARVLGYISQSDIPLFYAGAMLVAYPSLYEGFGLPVVEGMASGVPVLTSSTSCLPEIAGGAACLVDPIDTEAMVNGMRMILDDSAYRSALITAGLARAAEFKWADTIAKTVSHYQRYC